MTLKIGLFVEDQAHKSFISPLLMRLIHESSLENQVEDEVSQVATGQYWGIWAGT